MIRCILSRFVLANAFAIATLCLSTPAFPAALRFDEPTTYQVNKADPYSSPAVVGNSISITSGYDQTRSLWFKTPQNIGQFTASFTYRLADISGTTFGQGITFAVQSSLGGLNAIGTGGSGHLGYQGIAQSAAISIEVYNSASASTLVGSYTNGAVGGGGAISATPVDARQNREIDVTIGYDGTQLSVTMVDGLQSFGPVGFNVGSIASLLGSSTGFVGFTANTNGNEFAPGATQIISDFEFSSVPEPGCFALMATVTAAGLLRRPRLREQNKW